MKPLLAGIASGALRFARVAPVSRLGVVLMALVALAAVGCRAPRPKPAALTEVFRSEKLSAIDAAIDLLDRCPEAGVATLVTPLRRDEDLHDPAAVKAVLTPWHAEGGPVANAWRAVYFSRAFVPAARDWSPALLQAEPPLYWQHVGLYAYRRSVLEGWNALPESRLAALESLEQLRVVEAGIPIVAGAIDHAARGIDTPRDYAGFVERCRARAGA